MNYRIILPSVYKPYTDACLESMSGPVLQHTMIKDNTSDNIGVSASWNNGIREVVRHKCDWLICLSAAIRFNRGGDDFIRELEARPNDSVVEALGVYGWHLIAFNRRLLEDIGLFDENLVNYYSDIDYSLRIQKFYHDHSGNWDKVKVDVSDMGMAHGLKLAGVVDDDLKAKMYFVDKWGRHPSAWQLGSYDHPFNRPDHELSWWPIYDRSRTSVI